MHVHFVALVAAGAIHCNLPELTYSPSSYNFSKSLIQDEHFPGQLPH